MGFVTSDTNARAVGLEKKMARDLESTLIVHKRDGAIKEATVSVRIDQGMKAQAQTVLEPLGMTLSGAIQLLLCRVVRTEALPFDPVALLGESSGEHATALARARVESVVKDRAQEVLKAMGIDLSAAIRMLVVRVVKDQAFPFNHEDPNTETIAAMQALDRGEGDQYESVDALFRDLGI